MVGIALMLRGKEGDIEKIYELSMLSDWIKNKAKHGNGRIKSTGN